MSTVWIVILTLFAYHLIGIIALLVIDALNIDEDDFMSIYITGLIGVIFLLIKVIVKKIRRRRKQRYGAVVRRKSDERGEFESVLCRHKDLPWFENSNNWELVKRYPLPEDIFEGYYVERDKELFTDEEGEKIYRGYTLRNVTKQEIEEVKNERNCFNCVHNGKECNEDTCLCETDRYGNITDSYSGFERIANGKKK